MTRRGLAGLAAAGLIAAADAAALRPVDLRCETLLDPLGIDVLAPRLSWRCVATDPTARGLRHSAWQVRVASTPALLTAGVGDLWDSRRQPATGEVGVTYAGAPLGSRQDCVWAVRVWDGDGLPSAWSAPARWRMGLLAETDWQADWIGWETPETCDLLPAAWIWGADDAATCVLRREFTLDTLPETASLWIAASGEAEALLNGRAIGRSVWVGYAPTYDARPALQPGVNTLTIRAAKPGGPAGVALRLAWPGGEIVTDARWQADDSPVAVHGAVGAVPTAAAPWSRVLTDQVLPARYLRRDFVVRPDLVRAVVSFCGLGWSELSVNGTTIGDAVLSPGLTDYAARALYVTYHIRAQLRSGANTLGVVLGNGRFTPPRGSTRNFGCPRLRLRLDLSYADGGRASVVSDAGWRLTDTGPIGANNEYDGEDFDARRGLGAWDEPGFDAGAWRPAQLVAAPGGALRAQMIAPTRIVRRVAPRAVHAREPGVVVHDFGENFAGVCEIGLRGARGTRVQLRHAERLAGDGSLDTANLRSARASDSYVLSGDGEEIWRPRFTLHGFRYAEISGAPAARVTGCVMADDLETAGAFDCSDARLVALDAALRRTVRSNMRSLRTDCPQRDERQGWLGDIGECARAESFLFGNAALYRKILDDIIAAQRADGSLPDVCPPYWPLYSDDVSWPAASASIAEMLLVQHGDREAPARALPMLRRWIAHLDRFVIDGIIAQDRYGDWCAPPADRATRKPAQETDGALIATAYFYRALVLTAGFAHGLGEDDAPERARAATVAAAFDRRFRQGEEYGTPTGAVLALAFGLAPDTLRQRVADRLAARIGRDGAACTGLIGSQWIHRTLSRHGHADLVATMLQRRDYPSLGYMLAQGATTFWELWNGDTAPPDMNSWNHAMLSGDFGTWLREDLVGIAAAAPGFARIRIRPTPCGGIDWAAATHATPFGVVSVRWRREGATFSLEATLPPDTEAELLLPVRPDGVVESGRAFMPAAVAEDGRVRIVVGSGGYWFTGKTDI